MNPIPRTLSISELFLDPENPRLPNSLENSCESKLEEFLLFKTILNDLMLVVQDL